MANAPLGHLDRHPVCRVCLRAPSTEVDHVKPRGAGGDDSPENLQELCKGCHSRKTLAETRARGGLDS
ncbi:MAG: HNH endonuclease [Gammaproteobacteria bacterium]|nr:HNH endonuclease [Gammaproteobacteria bacterium]MDH3467476.1 HNH endonuclease [Gammaproteobacteria bacterium]